MKKIKDYKSYEDDTELMYMVGETEQANDVIFKKYEPVIDYYAKQFVSLAIGKGIDYNDLYQEGMIGLNSAINNYREHKNIKFSTFAFICIKRNMITAVRSASRKKHSVLNESYSLDYQNKHDKYDFSNSIILSNSSVEDLLVGKEDMTRFYKMLNEDLTTFEKQVYELRINGFSYDEIARLLYKTNKSIESALFRIRSKLKNILNKID